jgi:hypothetical protein
MITRARPALLFVLALGLASLAAGPPAGATVMVRRTVDELTSAADVVLVATARRASARWIDGRIYTDVEVTAGEVVRGPVARGATVVVRTPGGVVGNEGQRLAGAPVFEMGQRYVLFLRHGREGTYETVGLAQGQLPIREPAAPGGSPTVLPAPTQDLTLVEPAGARTRAPLVVPHEGMALDALLAALRAVR